MGITIASKRHSCDIGYGGFGKFRDTVARKAIEQNIITVEVANFLCQSDCDGKIDRKQAKQIYKLIEGCDDNISLGYVGRSDCAKMADIKKIFSDGTKVEWS